ncbi:hypothetical protein AAX09_10490 (plasmid) [Moraxella bovoculi]|uniref:hypothetical protein n=1 Tax=Moraxella bovoculi TaxID=386891 RepID=UPI0006243900|nr:hypothetical protein [Moraxella bovoculi]AKG19898.1 hypothetical protein AAX09_10490 [Moraxella bovoculi]
MKNLSHDERQALKDLAEIESLKLQNEKVLAETYRIKAETDRIKAETAKIQKETKFYPMVVLVISSGATTILGILSTFISSR